MFKDRNQGKDCENKTIHYRIPTCKLLFQQKPPPIILCTGLAKLKRYLHKWMHKSLVARSTKISAILCSCKLPYLYTHLFNLQVFLYLDSKFVEQVIHNFFSKWLASMGSAIARMLIATFLPLLSSSLFMLVYQSNLKISNRWILKDPFCLNYMQDIFCVGAKYGRLRLSAFSSSINPRKFTHKLKPSPK